MIEFQRRIARVRLIGENIGLADAVVDEGLAQALGQYGDEIGKLG